MGTEQGQIERAVSEALKCAPTAPQDGGATALALRYARALDADPYGDALGDVGPKLLAVLSALGMTPAGRGVKGGGQGANVVAGKLDELRARRNRRVGGDAA